MPWAWHVTRLRISHPDKVCQRLGLHFSHDVAAMHLYCDLADTQLTGNLLVQEPGGDEPDNLFFAGGQRCEVTP